MRFPAVSSRKPADSLLTKGHLHGYNTHYRAGVVQRLVHQPSKLRTRVRLPSPAPAFWASQGWLRRSFFVLLRSKFFCLCCGSEQLMGQLPFERKAFSYDKARADARAFFITYRQMRWTNPKDVLKIKKLLYIWEKNKKSRKIAKKIKIKILTIPKRAV